MLAHFRLSHEFEDASQFSEEMTELERKTELQAEFARLTEEWWAKVKKGEMTAEDYRRLTSQWSKENESSEG